MSDKPVAERLQMKGDRRLAILDTVSQIALDATWSALRVKRV